MTVLTVGYLERKVLMTVLTVGCLERYVQMTEGCLER